MELMYLFVGLLFGAIAARVRGFATWKGALGGLLLGPFALLLLFVSGDARCPACRQFIDPKATRCSHCTSQVLPDIRPAPSVKLGRLGVITPMKVVLALIILFVLLTIPAFVLRKLDLSGERAAAEKKLVAEEAVRALSRDQMEDGLRRREEDRLKRERAAKAAESAIR